MMSRVAECDGAIDGEAVCMPADLIVKDDPNRFGIPRRRLFFPFPDTDALVGLPADRRTLSGPAKILVTPVATPLACGSLAASSCADLEGTLGEIACVDQLFTLDGSCDDEPARRR